MIFRAYRANSERVFVYFSSAAYTIGLDLRYAKYDAFASCDISSSPLLVANAISPPVPHAIHVRAPKVTAAKQHRGASIALDNVGDATPSLQW
jgi:hypothetical protein